MLSRHHTSLAVSQSDAPVRSRVRLRNRKRLRGGLRQLTSVDLGLPQFTSDRVLQNEPTEHYRLVAPLAASRIEDSKWQHLAPRSRKRRNKPNQSQRATVAAGWK